MSVQTVPAPGRPSSSLHFVVGEMSGKLDQILLTLLPQITELDGRVSTIEMKLARYAGGFAVILFLMGSWEVVRYVILN